MPAAGEMARVSRPMLLVPLTVWVIMVSVGYWPTRSVAGAGGVYAMLAAQAMVVIIVYATLVPAMRRMAIADAPGRLQAALKAGTVRLILTLVATGVIVWRAGIDRATFLIWTAIAYVVMVNVETLVLVYWNKRIENER